MDMANTRKAREAASYLALNHIAAQGDTKTVKTRIKELER